MFSASLFVLQLSFQEAAKLQKMSPSSSLAQSCNPALVGLCLTFFYPAYMLTTEIHESNLP